MAEIVKTWFPFVFLACMPMIAADESPSPATVADAVTLASRVADLEARVQALEAAAKPVQAVAAKPILTVHSETWCRPCQQFKADLAAAGDVPVAVVYDKFSSRVPAFRWAKSDGTIVTRTGYTRGGLQALISEVVADARLP